MAKTAAERVDEIFGDGSLDVDGARLAHIAAIDAAVAEALSECFAEIASYDTDERGIAAASEYVSSLPMGRRDWGQKEYMIAKVASGKAIAEERVCWRRRCIDFSEQLIPETLMEKAEKELVSIRDAISLGWWAGLLALQAEVMQEKHGDAP